MRASGVDRPSSMGRQRYLVSATALAAYLLGGCGAAAPEAAPASAAPQPPPPAVDAAPPAPARSARDEANVAIAVAEVERTRNELDRLLAGFGASQQPNAPSAAEPTAGAEVGPRKAGGKATKSAPTEAAPVAAPRGTAKDAMEDARRERSEDACTTACAALASMARSTSHLCDLTGGGDSRCTEARARLENADVRVRGACPGCAR